MYLDIPLKNRFAPTKKYSCSPSNACWGHQYHLLGSTEVFKKAELNVHKNKPTN